MKIKSVQWIMAGFMTLSLSSCGSHNPSLKVSDLTIADTTITLEVLNPKVEISVEFEQMVKEYEKENPNINLDIVTVGGGANYLDELKASCLL